MDQMILEYYRFKQTNRI